MFAVHSGGTQVGTYVAVECVYKVEGIMKFVFCSETIFDIYCFFFILVCLLLLVSVQHSLIFCQIIDGSPLILPSIKLLEKNLILTLMSNIRDFSSYGE